MKLIEIILVEFMFINLIFFLLIRHFLKINRLEKVVCNNKTFSYRKSPLVVSKNNMKIFTYILNKIESDRLSFDRERDFRAYIFLQYLLPLALLLVVLLNIKGDSLHFILIPFFFYISNRIKFNKSKKKRSLIFQKNTYKVYKFIHNQISSGIRPHDCVIALYEVIEDLHFKRALINMSAIYSQTSNIDLSLKEINKLYPGIDSIMLSSAIKQSIKIGSNIDTIERQEKLAFNKYFAYIKNETEGMRLKGLINISLFALIIILLISIPLFYEMNEAASRIFSN